jgi:hypothetical protein
MERGWLTPHAYMEEGDKLVVNVMQNLTKPSKYGKKVAKSP